MTQRDDEIRRVHEALIGLPLIDRMSALMISAIECEGAATGPGAIAMIIGVAKTMAKFLPPGQQIAVCWYLSEALSELEGKWFLGRSHLPAAHKCGLAFYQSASTRTDGEVRGSAFPLYFIAAGRTRLLR
jgi:hypothetical protein